MYLLPTPFACNCLEHSGLCIGWVYFLNDLGLAISHSFSKHRRFPVLCQKATQKMKWRHLPFFPPHGCALFSGFQQFFPTSLLCLSSSPLPLPPPSSPHPFSPSWPCCNLPQCFLTFEGWALKEEGSRSPVIHLQCSSELRLVLELVFSYNACLGSEPLPPSLTSLRGSACCWPPCLICSLLQLPPRHPVALAFNFACCVSGPLIFRHSPGASSFCCWKSGRSW